MKVCYAYEVFDHAAFGRVFYQIFVVALCTCVVLVKVCYACEVFDHAAFGRVILKSQFLKALCSCVVLMKVCYASEVLIPFGISENSRKTSKDLNRNLRETPWDSKRI